MVSGTISLFSNRSAFHLSLTVLVRYRSHRSIYPYRMVPVDSRRISRVPRYSGYRYVLSGFEYGIITLCDSSFQRILLTIKCTITRSYNTAVALPQQRFGLLPVRSPLLRESFFYFLLLGVLRCFSSPGSPHCQCSDTCPSDRWVVPFGNPRINGYLHLHAAYRSLSRPSSPL